MFVLINNYGNRRDDVQYVMFNGLYETIEDARDAMVADVNKHLSEVGWTSENGSTVTVRETYAFVYDDEYGEHRGWVQWSIFDTDERTSWFEVFS